MALPTGSVCLLCLKPVLVASWFLSRRLGRCLTVITLLASERSILKIVSNQRPDILTEIADHPLRHSPIRSIEQLFRAAHRSLLNSIIHTFSYKVGKIHTLVNK